MNLWSQEITGLFSKGRFFLQCIGKKYVRVLFIFMMGLAFLSSSFLSCGPGFDDLSSQNPTNDDSDDDDDDDDDDDEGRRSGDCEEGGGDDTCKDDESCVRVCEHIYPDHAAVTECKTRSERQVGRMDKIHDLLMEKFDRVSELESNLESISEGDGDVSKDDFICYLEISGDKWIDKIEAGLPDGGKGDRPSNAQERLEAVLKWFVEEQDITEILREDVDDGDNILEALLVELESNHSSNGCIEGTPAVLNTIGSTDDNKMLWALGASSEDLTIHYYSGGGAAAGTITFDTEKDRDIYDALSCDYIEGDYNVFSYSAFKENEVMFEMGFELLTKVCDVEEKPRGQENIACARAMVCWTAWQNANGGRDGTKSPSDTENKAFWDMAEEHKSDLDGDQTRYNNCSARNFAEFFVSDD